MQQFVSLIISELLTYNLKHEMLTRHWQTHKSLKGARHR